MPVLFYALCAVLAPTEHGSAAFFVAGGWVFVFLRYVHSFIHLTYNRVAHRFARPCREYGRPVRSLGRVRRAGPVMNRLRSFCVLLVALLPASAAAQSTTVDQILDGLTDISRSKCQNRGALEQEFKAQGKIGEARGIRLAEKNFCECVPAQIDSLRASLPQQAREQRMTEPEFQAQYLPRIVNKCAAEQMRATYGEGCSEQFASAQRNSAAYCECMHKAVAQLADADIAQIGLESSDYMPRAAEARRRGEPAPEQPAGLKRFASLHASCTAK